MFDLKNIADELGFDEEDMVMLVDMFIDGCETSLEELNCAIKEQDFESIKTAAHSIKGSAANLRLTTIYDNAYKIESAAASRADIAYSQLSLTIEKELMALKESALASC